MAGSQRDPPQLSQFLAPASDAVSERSQWVGALPPDPPEPRPLPSEKPRLTRSGPSVPQRPEVAEKWEAVFLLHGRTGLQEAFYAYADEQLSELHTGPQEEMGNARASWGCLLRDRTEGTNLIRNLLHTLPDCIILALLKGELPRQTRTAPEVTSFVEEHMQLTPYPGIYINLLHDRDGRWLSSNDMETLLDKMEDYASSDGKGEPTREQALIDGQITAWNADDQDEGMKIRWLQSEHQAIMIREWVELARSRYCNNATDPTEPFTSCPTEVGWATNPVMRCKQHESNTGTTFLFGLAHGILRMSPSSGGFGWGPPTQLLLFPLTARDETMCRVAEVVGSLLSLSYWFLGGFNTWFGGGFGWAADTGGDDVRPPTSTSFAWGYNAQTFVRRLGFEDPKFSDAEKAKRYYDLVADALAYEDTNKQLDETRVAYERLTEDAEAGKADTLEKNKEVEGLQRQIEDMSEIKADPELEDLLGDLSLVEDAGREDEAEDEEWRVSVRDI
ncbi:hypothetical protein G7Y79_00008g023080 [Physcia stellaris]|nr:hypothetical protein G7Y79_00008g023080 [Physcia stellaris]